MDAIQAQLDAFNQRHLDGFLAAYADDAVIEDGSGQVIMAGHAGMRAMYGPLFTQSPNLHAEVVTRIEVGDYIIDEERTTGFNFPGFPTEFRAAVLYHLLDGRITRVRLLT
jgi:hypothetical protein